MRSSFSRAATGRRSDVSTWCFVVHGAVEEGASLLFLYDSQAAEMEAAPEQYRRFGVEEDQELREPSLGGARGAAPPGGMPWNCRRHRLQKRKPH
jgi:hypothetical protein